jgi:hypothetical protein
MEGARSDTEVGTVNESQNDSTAGANVSTTEATGQGDTTSFSADNVEKVDDYVVRMGDNLWDIAAKASVYHSGWLYPLILKANRSKIKDASRLAIGLELKIPRGLKSSEYEIAREEAMAGVYEGEVGPVKEMNWAPEPDTTTAKQAQTAKGTQTINGKAAKKYWFSWTLLLLLCGAGAWAYMKFKQNRSRGEAAKA